MKQQGKKKSIAFVTLAMITSGTISNALAKTAVSSLGRIVKLIALYFLIAKIGLVVKKNA